MLAMKMSAKFACFIQNTLKNILSVKACLESHRDKCQSPCEFGIAAKVFILILSSVTYRYNQQKALKITCRVYLVYWCLIVILRPLALEVQQLKIDHRSHLLHHNMFECLV